MDWNLVRSALVGTAIALPIVTGMGDFAIAQDRPSAGPLSFTIENFTQHTLEEYYVSPSSANDWEDNKLIDGPVPPGGETVVSIDDGRTDCLYDVLGVFSSGERIDEYQIDLCIHEGTFTYYDEEDYITFENQTSSNVVELYFTPRSDPNYGYELLEGSELGPGDTIKIPIIEPLTPEGCLYDFLAEFDDGDALEEEANICQEDTITFVEEE